MEINEIPKGQLPTIILTTLLSGDKYGYEIISEVENKTNGEVIIKKPSLYSSLSRMENQDLVSSYWKDSDIGGRRHYYRLTDYGRKQVLQWQEDLLLSQSNVSKMIETKPKIEKPVPITEIQENTVSESDTKKDIFAQQENLFDVLIDNSSQCNITPDKDDKIEILNDKKEVFLQYDLFNSNFISTPADELPTMHQQPYVFNMSAFDGTQTQEQNKTSVQTVTNQAETQISNQTETEYVNKDNISIEDILNARVEDKLSSSLHNQSSVKVEIGNFDIENELNNYKKNYASYSESTKNQSSNTVYDFVHIKPSLISKEPEIDRDESEKSFADKEQVNSTLDNDSEQEENNMHDDAVFITDELNEEDFKVKKIPPAIFHTVPLRQNQDEPHTMFANEEQTVQTATETYYENYDQLKKYFSKFNVNLKVYDDKSSDSLIPAQSEIKINKFKFLNYLIFFLLSCAEIVTCYFVLKRFDLLSSNNYLYYYISIITLITLPLIFYAIKFATNPNKKIAKQSVNLNPLWFKVCLIFLSAGIIYSLNMLFSLTTANWKYYISTLILPVSIFANSLITHLSKTLMLKDKSN